MKALQKFMTPQGECVIWQTTSEQDNDQFWLLMGRWFASKEVADVLGEPIYDHDDLVWTIAVISDKVVGFGAIDLSHADKKTALFNYGYISKQCRGTGIYRRIIEARIKIITEHTQIETIKALCTAESSPILTKLGFAEKSKRGRYTWFVKEVKR